MQNWFEFYAVIGAAAATLMGLLFVAVSVNAATVLSPAHDHARRLAEQAFQNYLTVLLLSLVSLFPGITTLSFGQATIALTAISAVWVLVRLYLALTRAIPRQARMHAVRRQLTALTGFSMMIYAAVRMVLGDGGTRNLMAAATMVLLFSATTVSWELLMSLGTLARGQTPDAEP